MFLGTEQHGDLRRISRLEVGPLGAFKGLLARQLTCSVAFAATLRARALHFEVCTEHLFRLINQLKVYQKGIQNYNSIIIYLST